MAKVRDAGHEIGLHGYTHEYISELSAKEQKTILTRSIESLTKFCGKKPLGYTAPAWTTSKELILQLEEAGILYDHSFMHHDLQPCDPPVGKAVSMVRLRRAEHRHHLRKQRVAASAHVHWRHG